MTIHLHELAAEQRRRFLSAAEVVAEALVTTPGLVEENNRVRARRAHSERVDPILMVAAGEAALEQYAELLLHGRRMPVDSAFTHDDLIEPGEKERYARTRHLLSIARTLFDDAPQAVAP